MKQSYRLPAGSRKRSTPFCSITGGEYDMLPVSTDKPTRRPRTSSRKRCRKHCLSFALAEYPHPPQLNNRRHAAAHRAGNQKKLSCFFCALRLPDPPFLHCLCRADKKISVLFGILKNRPYCAMKRENEVGKIKTFPWRENEKALEISVYFALCGVVGSEEKIPAAELAKNIFSPSRG